MNKAIMHTLRFRALRHNLAKNRMRNIWVVSYLVVLIIPLLLSLLIFGTSSDLVKRNTATINQLTLDQTSLSVNRIFSDTSSVAKQLLTQQEITSLSYAALPLNTYKRETIGKLQHKIREQTAFSNYIRDIYIYFDQLELASSSRGMVSRDWFFSQLESEYGITVQDLGAWNDSRDSYKMRILPVDPDGKSQGVALIAKNNGISADNDVICLILLSTDIFLDLLGGEDDYQHIFIMDNLTGGYLCRGGSAAIAESYFSRTDDGGAFTVSDEIYTPLSLSAGDEGLRIVSVMPIQQYTSQLNNIRTIYCIFLGVCLLFGLGISILFASRNYAPVKKLSSLMDAQNYKRETDNEFDYLTDSFSDLIAVKQSYEKELSGHKLILRQMNLRRMLHGTIYSRQAFESACTDYHIHFSSDHFFLIAVKVLDYAQLPQYEQDEEIAIHRPIFAACSQVLSALLTQSCDHYFCVEDEIFYAICATRQEPADITTLTGGITSCCKQAVGQLKEQESLTLMFYISDVYREQSNPVNSIHQAYRECLRALEQMEAFSMGPGAFDSDSLRQGIAAISVVTATDLSDSQQRKQLLQTLIKGRTDDAKAMLPQIMNGGIAGLSPEFFYIRMHCIFLADYIVSYMDDSRAKARSGDIQSLLSRILGSQNISELTKMMEDAVDFFIATFAGNSPGNTHSGLYLTIVEYIDSHFKDPNLTVASLTEHFGMSQSYLLRIFKKDSGSGILDYIHQRRVDESKLLLKNTSQTIAEIANAIGYSNQLALIRAFKRLEGITPSDYRNLN